MEPFLVGVSHHSAPLAMRERLAFDPAQRDALLAELAPELPEAAAIVTCNRTELYGLGAAGPALAALARHAGLTSAELTPYVERECGAAAARHLFRVAAGLDSLVLGEPQILGQVRAAIEAARAAGRGGPVLERLFNRAIVAGKRARSETPISQGAGSVSHAAVMLAREALGTLAGRRGLVIGLGEMGLVVARNLAAYGVHDLALCNRTEARAAAVAPMIGARVVPWAGLRAALAEADVAITATSAREPILDRATLARILAERAGRPLLLIDIAVPRDVDPAADGLPGLLLRDLDALDRIRAEGLRGREAVIPQVEAIVEEEVAAFGAWLRARQAVPLIRELRQRAEEIRAAEADKALRRLGHLDARDREVVLALSHAIANKLLHTPVTRLKAAPGEDAARALADLFGLEETL